MILGQMQEGAVQGNSFMQFVNSGGELRAKLEKLTQAA